MEWSVGICREEGKEGWGLQSPPSHESFGASLIYRLLRLCKWPWKRGAMFNKADNSNNRDCSAELPPFSWADLELKGRAGHYFTVVHYVKRHMSFRICSLWICLEAFALELMPFSSTLKSLCGAKQLKVCHVL